MATVTNDEGPSVNSKDKDERQAARRIRIEANIAAAKVGENGEVDVAAKRKIAPNMDKEMRKGKAQIAESRGRLDLLKADGIESVTSIRVGGDDRENQRRILAEARRQERRQKLLYEAESSAKRNAVVAMKWSALFDRDIPLELLRDMEVQKDACDRIITTKEDLIREFQQELKNKDDEYVKALKRQAEDIDTLLYHMGKHYTELRKAYEEELEEIEYRFMKEERLELIQANRTELDQLFEKRGNNEAQHLEQRQKRIEEDQRRLEQLRVKDAEDYNILKIKLETETQNLEQQLEEMRATYQLNTEKLEYNYRVLMERDAENINTINQQKRKLARLQDVLSGLMTKYNKTDKQYKEENVDLTMEYKRITEQFKDLQAKYKHFELSDNKRYREIWDMNEALVLEQMRKVLMADKIVHEQLLGLFWFPPNEEMLKKALLDSKNRHLNRGRKKMAVEDSEAPPLLDGRVLSEDTLQMLSMLCDEAGFLVDAKVVAAMQQAGAVERDRIRIDSMLKAIGIEKEEDIAVLLTYFKHGGGVGEDGEDTAGYFVEMDDVLKALKSFLEDQRATTPSLTRPTQQKPTAASPDTTEPRPPPQREENVWEMVANVISPKTIRVWAALEKFLQQYNALLQERAAEIEAANSLRTQNAELKILLNQYLNAEVNQDLHVPPTEVIVGLRAT